MATTADAPRTQVDAALAEMVVMRDREGAALDVELRSLLDQLEAFATQVAVLL